MSMTTGLPTLALAVLWLASDPFSLLAPAALSPADRRALERGEVISRTIEGSSGQIGVFAVSRIDVTAETLVVTARAIEDLKRSDFVKAIKRFSDPPRIEDLDALVLPPKEIQAALACRRGSCALKLTAAEIEQLHEAAAAGGDRDDRAQRAFRRIVLARASAYLDAGPPDLAPLAGRPVRDGIESFLYWSQETYGSGKPVVLVTHVNILPPASSGEPAIVIARQVFATHYFTGGVAVTAITTDAATGNRFLIYRNNSSVDLLGGILGPIRRAVLESRLKRDVPGIIGKLRARLEKSGRAVR